MDDPPLTDSEKATFKDIADNITGEAADKLLNHQLGRTRRWLRWARGNGYEPAVMDLVRQLKMLDIPPQRMLVAYAAALYRLAKMKEDDLERRRRGESEAT